MSMPWNRRATSIHSRTSPGFMSTACTADRCDRMFTRSLVMGQYVRRVHTTASAFTTSGGPPVPPVGSGLVGGGAEPPSWHSQSTLRKSVEMSASSLIIRTVSAALLKSCTDTSTIRVGTSRRSARRTTEDMKDEYWLMKQRVKATLKSKSKSICRNNVLSSAERNVPHCITMFMISPPLVWPRTLLPSPAAPPPTGVSAKTREGS
mmetsp:Transcript_44692/g.119159  ORF Transcript_44692/g.119159 Transcript_44692/m.119159 type:complete len:206 (-) Transcript_44692:889-1506(-)